MKTKFVLSSFALLCVACGTGQTQTVDVAEAQKRVTAGQPQHDAQSSPAPTHDADGEDMTGSVELPSVDTPTEEPDAVDPADENPDEEPVEGSIAPSPDFPLAEPDLSSKSPTSLWATYYYLPQVNAINGGYAMLDLSGKALGPRLSQRDWCNAAMEGSVRVVDSSGSGITYNYAGVAGSSQVDCSPYFDYDVSKTRFRKANGEFGDGVRDYRLIPFRTIAVDPTVIPYGSVVYIPAARGQTVKLFDGTTAVHDGFFFAGDTGGLIKTNHIDVFIGVAASNPFSWIGSSKTKTFTAYVLDDANAKTLLDNLHHGIK